MPAQAFNCPKCDYENGGHELICGQCQADLLVRCLTVDCLGKNRLGSNHCSTCGTNLVEYRLKRWRELDELLERAIEFVNNRESPRALELLNKVSAEQHEEFAKAQDEALDLVRQIKQEEMLEKQSEEAAVRGDWQKAEEILRDLMKASPARKHISDRINELRQRNQEQFGDQVRQAKDLADRANEALRGRAFKTAINDAFESLKKLPSTHAAVPQLVALMDQAKEQHTKRTQRILAAIGTGIGILTIAGHFHLAGNRPSYALSKEIKKKQAEITESLKSSEPPGWKVPNYIKTAVDGFRSPPSVVQEIGNSFQR
jgi:tetratricopeptide (TPR) repeat protein